MAWEDKKIEKTEDEQCKPGDPSKYVVANSAPSNYNLTRIVGSNIQMPDPTPQLSIDIVYLDNYAGAKELHYEHDGDSGFDLPAAKIEDNQWYVNPGESKVIKTGVKMAIPKGYELQVRTRSGSPLKRGFIVANSPGTVDSCYRGEIGVIVYNISRMPLWFDEGERIAQGVIVPVYKAAFNVVNELDDTTRGAGAYNSTGVK